MSDPERDELTQDLSPQQRDRVLHFHNLRSGARFASRYKIIEAIGHGGSGEVFRAVDEIADQEVALKVLFPGAGRLTLERLRRELRLMRDLSHAGILRIFDIGGCDGLLYLVSELLEGESLKERLAREGALPAKEAKSILLGILEALEVAHRAGVVHRDVKPGNIFLAKGRGGVPRRVVLLDFGLAREASGEGLTTVGRFVGTPEYSAPEQIRGEVELGPAADVYSCGVTAWQMISGELPFSGKSELDLMNAHLTEALPSPIRKLSAVRPVMRALVAAMLEKNPRKRPRDAGAARAVLERRGLALETRARVSLLLRRPDLRPRVAVGALLLLAAVLLVGWLLEPTDVRISGRDVVIATRLGAEIRSGPFDRQVDTAALDPRGTGPFHDIWVGLEPTPEGEIHLHERPQDLLLLSSVFAPGRRFLDGRNGVDYWHHLFPGHGGHLRLQRILPLASIRRAGEPLIAIVMTNSPNYSSKLLLIDERGVQVASYSHPGHILQIVPFRAARSGRLMLLIAGANNWVGPRHFVAAIPATMQGPTQGPPFMIHTVVSPAAKGWYLFLGELGSTRVTSLSAEGDEGRVLAAGGIDLHFHLESGVPVDAVDRGGLGAAEWERLRDGMMAALEDAAQHRQVGEPRLAAQVLESFVNGRSGPRELLSIPLYEAARARMLAARDRPGMSYKRAIEDMDLALALDPDPARYRLLRAELALRTGDTKTMATMLDRWGRGPEEMMYVYEWYLLNRLAGGVVSGERFLAPWSRRAEEYQIPVKVLMVMAHQRGEMDEVIRLLEGIRTSPGQGSVGVTDGHRYWGARACLDRNEADPVAALEQLNLATPGVNEGNALPLELARLHAQALLDGTSIDKQLLDRARKELKRFERDAPVDLHALAMLPFARQDMAAAEKRLGLKE